MSALKKFVFYIQFVINKHNHQILRQTTNNTNDAINNTCNCTDSPTSAQRVLSCKSTCRGRKIVTCHKKVPCCGGGSGHELSPRNLSCEQVKSATRGEKHTILLRNLAPHVATSRLKLRGDSSWPPQGTLVTCGNFAPAGLITFTCNWVGTAL